jgi:hypothetical protein
MPEKNYTFGTPNCVSNAITDAWTMALRGFEVRIAEYPTGEPGVNHAQAQALIHGEWRYLTRHLSDGEVRTWERHYPYREGDVETYKYLRDFINEQLPIAGQ